jgi:hypothetical protein
VAVAAASPRRRPSRGPTHFREAPGALPMPPALRSSQPPRRGTRRCRVLRRDLIRRRQSYEPLNEQSQEKRPQPGRPGYESGRSWRGGCGSLRPAGELARGDMWRCGSRRASTPRSS